MYNLIDFIITGIYYFLDPNDVESPRTSFILPPKLGINQQSSPVTPNAEDLSLILGSVQGPRGRSFSTTITPKFPDSKLASNVNANANAATESLVIQRKKSLSTSRYVIDRRSL